MVNRLVEGTFKKCDMHVHSSSCYSRTYDKDSFFESVLDSDLDVLAVTDHNSIDVPLLEELEREMDTKNKKLFGGVEMNVRLKDSTIKAYELQLGHGKKGKYFHAVVWFDMKQAQAVSDIVKELFVKAILSVDKSVTEEQVRSLSCKEFSKKTEGKAIYLEDFQEKMAPIPYFFVPHENKDRSLSEYLPNSSDHNQRYKDRLFYYSHAMAVEGGEKSRKHISEGLAAELNTTLSALFFSDAKKTSEIGSRFTWIDFDSDMDSLLLAISDPESRIKTSDGCPDLPQQNTRSFLKTVTFNMFVDGDKTKTRPQTLDFSPGYNGIVGARGSGKTLLACLLAGKDMDVYSQLVDVDSIKFTTYAGVPTADCPPYLYLGQGELESIYEDGEYEKIPFFNEQVSSSREEAKNESDKARERLKEILELEKNLLVAFSKKWSALVHIDFFNEDKPSGITIDAPLALPKDYSQIKQASERVSNVVEELEKNIKSMEELHFENKYPENDKLFVALGEEKAGILEDLSDVVRRVQHFKDFLDDCDSAWFAPRDELVLLFNEVLEDFNSGSDSSALNDYETKSKKAGNFYDDLFKLRASLVFLDDIAEKAYKEMRKPRQPINFENDGEQIKVMFEYDDEASYPDKIGELLNSSLAPDSQALIKAFLLQSKKAEMHKIFNGKRFQSYKSKDLVVHLEKFFELLVANTQNAGSLKTLISVGGAPIDEMSPGMKAQSLLKMFLNDTIKEGRCTYIVLDQPEDNLDADTIRKFLIERLKKLKLNVQFFVVSHSAPVIVNGDARTVVVCESSDDGINYSYGVMNDGIVKQAIVDVLDGGERYLKMRFNKYNFQVGGVR